MTEIPEHLKARAKKAMATCRCGGGDYGSTTLCPVHSGHVEETHVHTGHGKDVIPATDIKFSDIRTEAWLVTNFAAAMSVYQPRPCDSCGGLRHLGPATASHQSDYGRHCPDCHGTGRHCFRIEVVGKMVEATHAAHAWKMDPPRRSYRVHVLDIVPIYPIFGAGEVSHDRTLPHVMMDDTGAWYLDGNKGIKVITLPDDVKPGDWAVHLRAVTP